jgi:hypothetical protein
MPRKDSFQTEICVFGPSDGLRPWQRESMEQEGRLYPKNYDATKWKPGDQGLAAAHEIALPAERPDSGWRIWYHDILLDVGEGDS